MVRKVKEVIWFGSLLLLIFGCSSNTPTSIQTEMVSETDFRHTVPAGGKIISEAIQAGDYLYVATAQPRGYSIISIASKEIVSRINDDRLRGGLFAGKDETLYAPFYYKLYRITDTSSTQMLEAFKDDLFGVTDVHIAAPYLFVASHNGFYVFDLETEALLASFKNTNKNTTSGVSFYYNAQTGRLYVGNLRDAENNHSILLAADANKGFEPVWKIKLNGQMAAPKETPGINFFYETDSFLVCPYKVADSENASVAYLDKNTGEIVHAVSYFRGRTLFTPDRLYIQQYRPNQMAALDLHTRQVLWTTELDSIRTYSLKHFRDHLYIYRQDKKTRVIHTADGSSRLIEGAVSINPVYSSDLWISDRFFVIGGSICWDD